MDHLSINFTHIQLMISKFDILIRTFEIISILLSMIFFSLKNKSKNEKKFNQELMNIFIKDLDYSLRQLGISDIKIGKYVKHYIKKFYFRSSQLDRIFSKDNKNDFISFITDINLIKSIKHDRNFLLVFYNKINNTIIHLKKDRIYKGLLTEKFI